MYRQMIQRLNLRHLFVVTALVLCMFFATSTMAFAEEAATEQEPCVYAGKEYSHGAIIQVGKYYQNCHNGQWAILAKENEAVN